MLMALPLPPTINKQYATVQGRRVLSSQGRRYKTEVSQFLLKQFATNRGCAPSPAILQTHFLRLTLCFYFSSLLKRDLDGGVKITQDAICEPLEINDNRILELHLYKYQDKEFPRVECTLTPLYPLKK